jgi:hypothetical protein
VTCDVWRVGDALKERRPPDAGNPEGGFEAPFLGTSAKARGLRQHARRVRSPDGNHVRDGRVTSRSGGLQTADEFRGRFGKRPSLKSVLARRQNQHARARALPG